MRKIIIAAVLLSGAVSVHAQQRNPYMSEGYYRVWTDSLQAAIDADIERYRKADTVILLPDVRPGSRVKVEQTGHEFLFGSNIFLFGQLGSQDRNSRYEDCFGTLFNGATVPFYWKTLEPEKGHPRYTADSPGIYRRPAPDPVVEFCLSKGIRMKGHALIYGIRSWGHPEWMPEDRGSLRCLPERWICSPGKR